MNTKQPNAGMVMTVVLGLIAYGLTRVIDPLFVIIGVIVLVFGAAIVGLIVDSATNPPDSNVKID